MILERLSQEHRNIEKLLAVLERELEVFARGDRPDYEVVRALSATSKSTRKCITIHRKTWSSPS
jgi:hypothetical protein